MLALCHPVTVVLRHTRGAGDAGSMNDTVTGPVSDSHIARLCFMIAAFASASPGFRGNHGEGLSWARGVPSTLALGAVAVPNRC